MISGDTYNRVLIYNMYWHFLPWTTKIPNIKKSYYCIRANLQYITPKEHLRLTGLSPCVRACVRTSRWKKLFTPYLVVELSPSAEIWCVCSKYQ